MFITSYEKNGKPVNYAEPMTYPNDGDKSGTPLCCENYIPFLKKAGSLETTIGERRRHLVSFRDCQPFWAPSGCQLPRRCDKSDYWQKFRVRTGKVNAGSKAYVQFKADSGDADKLTVFVNDKKTTGIGGGTYKIDDSSALSQVNTVEVNPTESAVNIIYIEIAINLE